MTYLCWLIRKIRKQKANWIPLIFVLIFLGLLYGGSWKSAQFALEDPIGNGTQELEQVDKSIEYFEQELDKDTLEDSAYEVLMGDLDTARMRKDVLEKRLQAMQDKNWQRYYFYDHMYHQIAISALMQEEAENKEVIEALSIDQAYDQYQREHEQSFDNRYANVQGVSFLISASQMILPFILSFVLIFIVSVLCNSCYENRLFIHGLIPGHKITKQIQLLMAETVISLFLAVIVCMFCLLLGAACMTLGNGDTPIRIYGQAKLFQPVSTVFIQWCITGFLSILFLSCLVSLVSYGIRNTLGTIGVCSLLILGGIWISEHIVPLFSVIHLFPSTYFQSLKVISGQMTHITGNTNIDFMHGMWVLITGCVILFGLRMILERKRG